MNVTSYMPGTLRWTDRKAPDAALVESGEGVVRNMISRKQAATKRCKRQMGMHGDWRRREQLSGKSSEAQADSGTWRAYGTPDSLVCDAAFEVASDWGDAAATGSAVRHSSLGHRKLVIERVMSHLDGYRFDPRPGILFSDDEASG
jgi:hypothetical protein